MTYNFAEVIEQIVRAHFGAVVDSVRVSSSIDSDGDSVFIVNVIFTSKGPLDDALTSSVIRLIRRELRKHSDETFPIISYTSKSDYLGARPEAA